MSVARYPVSSLATKVAITDALTAQAQNCTDLITKMEALLKSDKYGLAPGIIDIFKDPVEAMKFNITNCSSQVTAILT